MFLHHIYLILVLLVFSDAEGENNKYERALQDVHVMRALYRRYLPTNIQQEDKLQNVFRFKLFERNVREVVEINNKQRSYEAEVNFMSYLTSEEKLRYAGFNVSDLLQTPRAASTDLVTMETEINWVESGHVTYVTDQGMCGSCWTFAGTGPVETRYALKTGTLKKFSEQESLECVYNKNEKNGCRGGQYFHQWEWIKKVQKQSSARDYPYKGTIFSCRSRWFKNHFTGAKITGYLRTEPNYKAMEGALSSGPLAVGLRISKELYQYRKGVFVKEDCGTPANHAVVAVGYTPAYFLLKNSWGEKWGESGFVKFSRAVENMCDVALWAAYPVIEKTEEEVISSKCSDTRGDCAELKGDCGNGINWKIMATGCAATCGICGCRDAMEDCAIWAKEGYCTKPNYKEYMGYYCPLSCRKCDIHPNMEEHECEDTDKKCAYYKGQGYCERYPKFVSTRCRKTCGLCGGKSCEDMGLVFCHGECRHAHMC